MVVNSYFYTQAFEVHGTKSIWGAGGRRFKSSRSDQHLAGFHLRRFYRKFYSSVAQPFLFRLEVLEAPDPVEQ